MSLAPPLWTAEQQAWLAALGHAVYVRGTLPEAVEPPAPVAVEAGARAPAAARRPRPAPADVPVVAPAPTPSASARRPARRGPDPLLIALIRAAAIKPDAPGMEAVIAQWPPSAELRGNPAAKRELWPRLRALRKGRLQ